MSSATRHALAPNLSGIGQGQGLIAQHCCKSPAVRRRVISRRSHSAAASAAALPLGSGPPAAACCSPGVPPRREQSRLTLPESSFIALHCAATVDCHINAPAGRARHCSNSSSSSSSSVVSRCTATTTTSCTDTAVLGSSLEFCSASTVGQTGEQPQPPSQPPSEPAGAPAGTSASSSAAASPSLPQPAAAHATGGCSSSSGGGAPGGLWVPPQRTVWVPSTNGRGASPAAYGPPTHHAAAAAASAAVVTDVQAPAMATASIPAATGPRLANVFMAAAETRGLKDRMEDKHVMAALDPAEGVQAVTGPVMPQQQVSMAGVFDGHAGACTATYAARNFPQLLHKALVRQHQQRGGRARGDPTRAALYATFHGFDTWWNDARCDPAYTTHGWDESGATAVVGLISGGHAVVANTGDSVALLIRPSGVKRLSEDHRLGNPAEAERVLEAGGRLVAFAPGKQPRVLGTSSQTRYKGVMVTRALGDFAFKHPQPLLVAEPHIVSTALAPEDSLLLLATDGVTDVLSDVGMMEVALEAIMKAKRNTQDGRQLAIAGSKAVTEAAIEHGSRDNITALTMLLDWEGQLL